MVKTQTKQADAKTILIFTLVKGKDGNISTHADYELGDNFHHLVAIQGLNNLLQEILKLNIPKKRMKN